MKFDPADEGWKKRDVPGYMSLLGPLWSRREEHGWVYGMTAEANHLNPAGFVHGGMLMSLADQALSIVVWEAMERARCVTVQLDSHFLAAVRAGDFIQARAQVTRKSRSLVFIQGTLTVEGEPVATASGMWKVVSPREG
jgi:uncharacterized protein (TIGR00369 family)